MILVFFRGCIFVGWFEMVGFLNEKIFGQKNVKLICCCDIKSFVIFLIFYSCMQLIFNLSALCCRPVSSSFSSSSSLTFQPLVSRPAPPNKPLPPDPVTPAQVSVPLKPVVPKKPRPPVSPPQPYLPPHPGLPANPGYAPTTKLATHGAVAPAAGPTRRPPLRPTRPAVPPKFESSPPL
uniref:A disintegrin and metalloproteinase domain 15 n=1 Tax=Nothobranchius furzeri TaxID=105023 RepID=A0A1A8VKA7_NOTFU